MLSVLEEWDIAQNVLLQIAADPGKDTVPLASVHLLAPIPQPGAIYGAGANYVDHIAEMDRARGVPVGPTMKEQGDIPWHFMKTSRGTVVGPGFAVEIPNETEWLDWEIELVAVIGKRAKNVSVTDALDYVAGYTIANDLSARDHMKRPKQDVHSPFHFDWVGQKCFDGACPIGPWIVPAHSLPSPHRLGMKLWVGNELMQDSNTSNLIFNIPDQIAALSARVTLFPGDLILTGTPAGVGMSKKRFLKSGEELRLWIQGIGELRHSIA